jgi:hypothetical protein
LKPNLRGTIVGNSQPKRLWVIHAQVSTLDGDKLGAIGLDNDYIFNASMGGLLRCLIASD